LTALPSLSLSAAASLLSGSVAQAITSRLDFLALLGEHDRLLQVRTALPALALLPEALHGVESVNAPGLDGFAFELDALSTNAHFELKRLIGEQITVRLRQLDGSYRALHGYVTAAAQLGGNGGLARYRLSLRSWAAFTALRADSWVFQDQDVRAIVEAVLADHPQAHWEWTATRTLKPRALCTQYNESDAAFIARLLAEEGLAWHFEQLQGDAADAADAKGPHGHARHRLVIHDADSHPQRTHLGTLRFAAAPVVGSFLQAHLQNTLHQFSAERAFTALGITQASWDPVQLAGVQASSESHLDVGDMPRLGHYVGQGERRFADALHAQARSDAGVQALELGLKRYQGLGTARHLQAGCQFTLVDHSQFGANTTAFNDAGALLAEHKRADNAFTLTQLQHRARNNLGADMARLLDTPELAAGHYEVALQAAPAAAPLTPTVRAKPTACGAQVARVVGVPSETLSPDRNLRIKVQFPWQRGQQPNPGGLPAPQALQAAPGQRPGPSPGTSRPQDALCPGSAPGDHRASAWVRVAQPQAGANWGQHFSPRIGAEVLVGFVEGDIDRPLVMGQLYNAEARPPWSAGEGSGANHPGTLSGLRSQGLAGDGHNAGHNHWLLDDTPGQLRTRLMSSHASAEASLGELIGHNPLSSTRGAWRGTGAELSTQGWGTLRARQGLLLSATARAGSYGSAQGTQMDSQEALAQLRGARDLGQRLSAASTPAGAAALKSVEPEQAVHTLVQDLDPAVRGKFPATVDGQSGLQDASGRSPADPVPRPARPYVLLDTPSTLAHATQGDVMRLSGLSMSRITQGDQHDTAAHTAVHVAGQQMSLYSHQGQLQVKAAAGPVSIQAHTDALEILADQSVQILSVNDRITISAKNSIEIVAGDSKVTLKGGDVEFSTPGTFEVKSATHNFLGGGSGSAELPALPQGKLTEPPVDVELHFHYDDLSPVANAPYKITFEDGSTRQGTLDASGYAIEKAVPKARYTVEYGEDGRAWQPPPRESDATEFKKVQAQGQAAIEAMLKREPAA
jgi:type VI secretion system secreted protein VgrG